VPLTFFGEYHAEIVTAAADPTFMNEPNDTGNRDMHWLTAGVRARVYRGITLDAGADVRLRSVGYEYGAPLPPYNIVFGAAYPFDIDAFTKPVVVTRTIEKTVGAPRAARGPGQGIVKSARDGKPIAGALISAGGRPLSRVGTDPDGPSSRCRCRPAHQPRRQRARVRAAKVNAVVVLAHPTKVDVTLTPKVVTGNVRGTVKDAKGTPLPAALRLAGAEVFSAQADSNGVFSAALPVGAYRVTAEMPQMPPKEATVDVVEGQDRHARHRHAQRELLRRCGHFG
jgi:hypothetical protein